MTVRIGRRDVEFGRIKNVLDGVLLTESRHWLIATKKEKKFLEAIYEDGYLVGFNIIDKCPVCRRLLTVALNY